MKLFPSRTIAWYTARMFLIRSAAFLLGLILILESMDLLTESGKILAVAGNGEAELWRYVTLRVPQLVQLFLPFSVLLATLITLATLNQNSEVVIFKAAGISAHQILLPLFIASLGIAALNFVFNEAVTTRASQDLKLWQDNGYKRGPSDAKPVSERWVRGGDDLVRAIAVTGTGAATRLQGVTIYDRDDNRLVCVIMADSATPIDGGWRLTNVRSVRCRARHADAVGDAGFQDQRHPAAVHHRQHQPGVDTVVGPVAADRRAARRGQAGRHAGWRPPGTRFRGRCRRC